MITVHKAKSLKSYIPSWRVFDKLLISSTENSCYFSKKALKVLATFLLFSSSLSSITFLHLFK